MTLQQLTNDHSLAAEYERRGEVLPAQREALANVLTRCLGAEPHVEVDISEPIQLVEGAALVICSDGLTKVVTDEEILEVVTTHRPEPACAQLVDLALERGGPDNVTVQVALLTRE